MNAFTEKYLAEENERIDALRPKVTQDTDLVQRVPEFNLDGRLLGYFDPWNCRDSLSLSALLPFFQTIAYRVDPSVVHGEEAYEKEFGVSLRDSIALFECGRILPLIDTLHGMSEFPSYLEPLIELGPPSLQRAITPYSDKLRFIPYEMDGVSWFSEDRATRQSPYKWYTTIFKRRLREWLTDQDVEMLMPVVLLYTQYAGYEFGYLALQIAVDLCSQGYSLTQVASVIQQIAGHFAAFVIGGNANPLFDEKAIADIGHATEVISRMRGGQRLRIGPADEELAKQLPVASRSEYDTVPVQMYADLPDATNFMRTDNLAKFHRFINLSVPRHVGNPLHFAKRLEVSDNVKEHWRILKEFETCLSAARYRDGCDLLHTGWRELAGEVKREMELIERTYSRTAIEITVVTSFIGTAIGGALGQLISHGELGIYFAVVGAHAASVLTGRYREEIAKRVSRPLGVRNLSFMIWKATHD